MNVLNLLFSASMVKAIIREIERPGTGKTQTRRVVENHTRRSLADKMEQIALVRGFEKASNHSLTEYPLIYVREAWRVGKRWDGTAPRDLPARTMTVFFEAGGSISGVAECPKDRPRPVAEYVPDLRYPPSLPDWAGQVRQSMFLPRWASRLTLEVTDVRVERLNDISIEDALAEGVTDAESTKFTRVAQFKELWDSINGDRPGLAWKYNPWVVAISFRPHLINIDAFLETRADALKEIGG